MFFFGRKVRREEEAKREAEIEANKEKARSLAYNSARNSEELAKLLQDPGVTERLFLATGGDKRMKRK